MLVDRSSPAEKRNLRWDVLPVRAPGGLLHAKVAVLIWERAARIVDPVGREPHCGGIPPQRRSGHGVRPPPDCQIPASIVADVSRAVRNHRRPGAWTHDGAKARANATLDLLDERARSLNPTGQDAPDLLLAVAVSRPGTSPLDRLTKVWRGVHPLRATVLSPFWTRRSRTGAPGHPREPPDDPPPSACMTCCGRILSILHRRHQRPTRVAQPTDAVVAFDPPDTELWMLHAKVLRIESDEWGGHHDRLQQRHTGRIRATD